jgi:tetratricopeptide (TPR) repeat protein
MLKFCLTLCSRMRRINNSLIKRRLVVDADACFSMHRSLQRGIREKLSRDKGKQQRVFDQAVALVRENFPQSNPLQQPTPEKWSEYQKLLPHLHALRDVFHASKGQIKGSIDFAQLLSDAGMDQFERGITREGLLLLNTAERVLDDSSDPNHEAHQVMKADINAMIAIMYDDFGIEKRREAFVRRELALKIREKIFEEAKTQKRQYEILLYNSWMEYAISLLHYHDIKKAEPIIEKCLTKFREWGTEDEIPFEYAKYYNKIALVRMYQGKFEKAISLATRGVQLMEKTGYNMFTGRFKFDLACIILQSGDVDGALRTHRQTYNQRIEMVGPTNQLSLHSIYAIGAIHELKGELSEAEYVVHHVSCSKQDR